MTRIAAALMVLIFSGNLFAQATGVHRKNPGTEVDGGHTYQQSWLILEQAVDGLLMVVARSGYLRDLGQKSFVERVLKGQENNGPHLTAEWQKKCYRNSNTNYPLMVDYDMSRQSVTVCNNFFETFASTAEAEFPNAIWLTQKKILHEVSHLLGYRTFDGQSDKWARRILCEFPDSAVVRKNCFTNPSLYASIYLHKEASRTSIILSESDKLRLLRNQKVLDINRPSLAKYMIAAVVSAVTDLEEHFAKTALADFYTDIKFDEMQATHSLYVDQFNIILRQPNDESSLSCQMQLKVSVRNNLIGLSDRSTYTRNVVNAEDCLRGSLDGSEVLDLLEAAVSFLHPIESEERQFKLNVEPKIANSVSLQIEGVDSADKALELDLKRRLNRQWSSWLPDYNSVIWELASSLTRRSEDPPKYHNISLRAVNVRVFGRTASVETVVQSTDVYNNSDYLRYNRLVSLTGNDKGEWSESITKATLTLVNQVVEEVSTFASRKACKYIVNAATGAGFTPRTVDSLEKDEVENYLKSLELMDTPLRQKVFNYCSDEFKQVRRKFQRRY